MLYREKAIKALPKDYHIIRHSNITFQELPFFEKINLRGDPNNDFILKNSKILGSVLPVAPNTYTHTYTKDKKLKVIWLGPNEWLIVIEYQSEKNDIFSKLQSSNNDKETSVTDVSENRTIIRISGEKLFILLSKFLTLDLDKNLSDQLCCAQTLFAKVPILLVSNNPYEEIPKIDLFINRSHANYIYNLLVDGTKNLDF